MGTYTALRGSSSQRSRLPTYRLLGDVTKLSTRSEGADTKKQRLFDRPALSKWRSIHPTKTPCYLSCSRHQSSPSAHTRSSLAEYRLTSSHLLCCTHPHYWVHLPEHMPPC